MIHWAVLAIGIAMFEQVRVTLTWHLYSQQWAPRSLAHFPDRGRSMLMGRQFTGPLDPSTGVEQAWFRPRV